MGKPDHNKMPREVLIWLWFLRVTWFTNLIYSCITFAVASGDSCPFVGHNAILRWSAIQDAAAYMDEDGYEKFWSEYHVSEDFDMALRLQVAGYSLRYASYTGDGFKEGVSLTVYDELKRWEKYAYGCNELVFHPFRFWITKGPFTKLFKKFIFSSIPLPKKVTILAYIGTYYAIASAWLITLMNYFITGWFHELADKYYLDSFSIYIATVFVFTGFGNIALGVLRYRLNQKDLLQAGEHTALTIRFINPYLYDNSFRELPMGPYVYYLSRWHLTPPLTGDPVSLLRDRHKLGCNIKGG